MKFVPGENKLKGILNSFVRRKIPYVELNPSSSIDEINYPASNVLDINNETSHWVSNDNPEYKEFLIVSVLTAKVKLSHYSIRSHIKDICVMKGWELSASNDSINYEVIHKIDKTNDLLSNGIGFYTINSNKYYQYFKIRQTSMLDSTSLQCSLKIRITNLEFFGELQLLYNCNTLKRHRNNMPPLIYVLFAICTR